MRTAFCLVAIILAMTAVAQDSSSSNGDNTVQITTCDIGTECSKDCRSKNYTAGACLEEKNTGKGVELSCPSDPAVCVDVHFFKDSSCHVHQDLFSSACGNCNPTESGENFMIVCGALEKAVIFVYNCSDDACGQCGGSQVVTFDSCTAVDNDMYVIIRKPIQCSTVRYTQYSSSSCTGNATAVFNYPNDRCVTGTTFDCMKSSGANVDNKQPIAPKKFVRP